jgi:hypothetical protein
MTTQDIFASVFALNLSHKLLRLIRRTVQEGKLFFENAEFSKRRIFLG